MASYTFTRLGDRAGGGPMILRGRYISSVDVAETASWQEVTVPTLPNGVGVVCIDVPASGVAIRVAVREVALVTGVAVQGFVVSPGQSLPLEIGAGDILQVRTA